MTDDVQDFVFLGESRPVFVRLHVRTDGKALEAAWNDFMKYLFAYLDVDSDGVLSKAEAERAPAVDQLRNGGQGGGFAGFGGGGQSGPSFDALDTDKDGKVTLAELSAWYRKNGFAPFQFQFSGNQANPAGMARGMLGGQAEPSATAVSESIFALLDTDRDGKLTKEKLAAAPTILLRLDENEDEMIIPRELVPNAEAANPIGMFMMMGNRRDESANNKHVVPITTPGHVPPRLVQMIRERYGPKAEKPDEKRLTRADLGLDEATFAKLDANGDGVLDNKELEEFVNRPADLELVVRLGSKKEAEKYIESLPGKEHALAGKFSLNFNLGHIDLVKTRLDILTSGESASPDRFAYLAREQYLAQFRQIDKENKGFIDAEQAKNNGTLRRLFKAADRDGDGKLTEKKLIAYLEHLAEMQSKATAACVTLEFSDQNRGLFDLLDTDRDGRLSVREMRNAVKLLDQLDRDKKGYITKDDIPKMYKMTVRQGPVASSLNGQAAFFALYGGDYGSGAERPGRGPLWFQKMDRNRDGDVSRKEWLWSEELFKKIDTDGDGLISVEEAEAYDALMRKESQGK